MKKIYITFIIILVCCCFSCKQEEDVKKSVVYQNIDFKLNKGILFYKGIPFTGELHTVDSLMKTKNTIQYKNGKKEGSAIKEYDNGKLAEIRFYTNGNKSGVHKAWWTNGNLKFEYHFNANGEYNGEVKEWYKNGQQVKAFHFINGKEEGSQKMWQPDGKIRANFVTKNGERFGLVGLKKCYSVNIKNEEFK